MRLQAHTRNLTTLVRAQLPHAKIVALGDGVWAAALTPGVIGPGGALELVDVLIPRMSTLMNTSVASTQRVKAAGKLVGWYASGNFPDGPYALNLMVEYSAIRPRLLLGTAAWKLDVGAFLYDIAPPSCTTLLPSCTTGHCSSFPLSPNGTTFHVVGTVGRKTHLESR